MALPALLLPLAGCSDDRPPPTYSGSAYEDVAVLMQRALNQRARAVTSDDLSRFRRTLDRSDHGLVEDQQTYWDNLQQLPIGTFRYRVDTETITPVDGTDDYWAEVVLALELVGYDAAPVRTRDRFRFRVDASGERMLVASTTDFDWETDHPGNAQPWDLQEIEVEERGGVLGIFDDTTIGDADAVILAASNGRYDVRSVVGSGDDPVGDRGVVVYAVQDPTFLRGLAGQTVGDPDRADGLTIAVPVDQRAAGRGTASYRVFLNARILDESPDVLGRLVRHELTHATLGARGRGAPLWLTEGLAEYVSVRPMAPAKRRLPASALSIGTTATDLPGDAEFASADAEAWYAVSWWVCEYVATSYGPDVLLLLLDRLAGGAAQEGVLGEVLGLTGPQLAQRGVALMETTYGS
ncbi:hypothetical protein GCM10025786_05540 [Nocardioides caeni]